MVGFRVLGFGGGRFRHYRYRLRDRHITHPGDADVRRAQRGGTIEER